LESFHLMINDLIFYPKVVSESLIISLIIIIKLYYIEFFFVIERVSTEAKITYFDHNDDNDFESQVVLKAQSYFMKVETEQRYVYVKILIIFR